MSTTGNVKSGFLLVPMPAELRREGGTYELPEQVSVFEETRSVFTRTVRSEISARNEIDRGKATVRLLSAASAPQGQESHVANPEGYSIRIDRSGIDVWASAAAGHFYAVMTIRQLIRQFGRRLPCMRIADSPRFPHRGVQLAFPQGHTGYRHAYMKRLVPTLARWKINELHLYLESFFDFPSLPHMAGPGAMTPDDARALDRLCGAYNIKVIPMLNTLGHCGEILATQRYQHLSEYDPATTDPRLVRPFDLCASSQEVHALVAGMLNDLCDCFTSDVIHVGGDEVESIGTCPTCRSGDEPRDAFALYLEYFDRVLGVLEQRGRKGALWGDMLLEYVRGKSTVERRALLRPFTSRSVIYDWHYSGGSRESLEFFADCGFTTIACSSTHLCYSSALWPSQHNNQWELFRDAAATGVAGGMTTAWANWNGLHEEHFNYLHATGAAMLWSGPADTGFAKDLSIESFEAGYSLHRYGLTSTALTAYLHAVGDLDGPLLSLLAPYHGVEVRKCLYHTDNPLLFWKHYARILGHGGLKRYKAEVARARRLWNQVQTGKPSVQDRLLDLHVGPLLMHEHLVLRFEMTEEVYSDYDAAARAQYEDPARFREHLGRASARLLAHLSDFAPVERYLANARRIVGLDQSTLNRMRATKDNIRVLAAFIRHLRASHRPLPAFRQLAETFLETFRTRWYGDREHEWAAEDPRFVRYTVNERGPWTAVALQQR